MKVIRACRVAFLPVLFFTFTACLPALSHATMILRPNHAYASPRKHRRTVPDRPFREVPRSHSAYKVYDRLVKAGLAVYPTSCFPDRHSHFAWPHPTLTRYEFAVMVQRVQAGLAHPDDKLRHKISPKKLANLRRDVARLATIFRPELRELSR